MGKCDIGVIGMAVMGQNLVLNMNDHGFKVAVYNRTTAKMTDFIQGRGAGREIYGAETLEEFVNKLGEPRIILLMIKAGRPVDLTIEALKPLLKPGDIIMDGGNSYFKDTIRRTKKLEESCIHYIGTGFSGGELGARRGPSITPGGSHAAWPTVQPILQAIAAKLDDGSPTCEWIGSDGAGHYVKMVHNGIEYGFMQLIAETFQIMKDLLGMDYNRMAAIFKQWDQGKLKSFLVEITGDILAYRDESKEPLLPKILDAAGQKGTGRWTSESAMELGIPLTLVTEAVFARALSALKAERTQAEKHLPTPAYQFDGDIEALTQDLENALYLAEILSYSQGFMLFHEAAKEYKWGLNFQEIANIWRDGCIIRSALLTHIRDAYKNNGELENLLLDPFFLGEARLNVSSLRAVIRHAVAAGIPVPALSAALSFFDGYRSGSLPANLIQAQRDYFGSHTYERVDTPRGEFFHTDWTGKGGDVTASSYNA
jgi:6-phosphogluconate dehydrogenase